MIPEKIQEVIKKRDKKERNPGLNVAAMARQDQRLMESIVAPEGMEFVGRDFCLHPKTELLTKHRGWVPVLELVDSDEVWQVDPETLKGSWTTPSRLIQRHYVGNMFTFGDTRGSLTVTENHTMLWITRTGPIKSRAQLSQKRPAGNYRGLSLCSTSAGHLSDFSPSEIEIACALQADGSHLTKNTYTIEVLKPKKQKALGDLLGAPTRVTASRSANYPISKIWVVEFKSDLLTPGKRKLLNPSLIGDNQLDIFVKSLAKWDAGQHTRTRFRYFSSEEENIDRIQERLVRGGFEARKTPYSAPHLLKPHWYLSISSRGHMWITKQIKEHQYDGMVGCVTVNDGFILVRSEGQTFVTGNCSLEPSVTAEYSKDPLYSYANQTGVGKKPYWDESNNCLMISDIYQLFGSKTGFMGARFRAAWDKHNFYDLWLKDSEAVKNHPDIKPLRKFSKVCVLGIERGMGATKLKKDAQEKAGMEITMAVARQCINDFWKLFSGLEALKTHLSNQALEHGAFITPLGFRVPCDDYKAYPFFTQAVANDAIMLYRTYYQDLAPWAQIITPIHDELVYMRPIARRDDDSKAHEQALELTNKTLKWGTPLRMSCSYGPTFYDIK